MKKFNLFVGMSLITLLMINCKKNDIIAPDNGNPIIQPTWEQYVGNWNLIKETNPQGMQVTFGSKNLILNEDLSVTGNFIGRSYWKISNNKLQCYFYSTGIYSSNPNDVSGEDELTIISISSTILVLSNWIDVNNPVYNNPNTFTFQKQ